MKDHRSYTLCPSSLYSPVVGTCRLANIKEPSPPQTRVTRLRDVRSTYLGKLGRARQLGQPRNALLTPK